MMSQSSTPRTVRPRPNVFLIAALLASLLGALSAPISAQGGSAGYSDLRQLLSGSPGEARRASKRIIDSTDRRLAAGLVDAIFFAPQDRRPLIFKTLEKLTGAEPERRYHSWVEWIGANEDIDPREGYRAWKRSLFSKIDTRYEQLLFDDAKTRIRLEEVLSGGVPLEGIPSLDDPKVIPAGEATYLEEDEDVFGVFLGGEARAYPVRFLSWHEMLNDRLADQPITLSYCTLCGSAILYSGRVAGRDVRFGTSGLLYRSNKLMIDRESFSLWSNLSGEPVFGRLVGLVEPLDILPMTLTTWAEWKAMHPTTTVVALDAKLSLQFGFNYTPGAADEARAGVAFPVWQRRDRLQDDEEIYAVRLGERTKAYPIDAVLAAGTLHDRLGDTEMLLIGDPASGSIRVYRTEGRRFRSEGGRWLDGDGAAWRLTEEALVREGASDETPEKLTRIPGHHALWFGWVGVYPDTEVYSAAP